MKPLFAFLLVTLFGFNAHSQILNGGFEAWTDGKPDDWAVKMGNLDSDSYNGNFCIGTDFADDEYRVPRGTIITNSTKLHPGGSAVTKNASSIVFWFRWDRNEDYVSFNVASPGNMSDTLLKATHTWTKFSIPILALKDSVVLEFRLDHSAPRHHIVGGFFKIDDIAFETSSAVSSPEILSNTISVSPNPISDHANLNYHFNGNGHIHAAIFDITGREVMKLPSVNDASTDGTIPFDCNAIPNGLYYLRFEKGGAVVMRKIVVQH